MLPARFQNLQENRDFNRRPAVTFDDVAGWPGLMLQQPASICVDWKPREGMENTKEELRVSQLLQESTRELALVVGVAPRQEVIAYLRSPRSVRRPPHTL